MTMMMAFSPGHGGMAAEEPIALPEPRIQGEVSLEAVLAARRSVRRFSASPVTLAEVGQLLWAAQGITSPNGFRTAPSAGALYPLEVHVIAGDVEGLPSGIYRYQPVGHDLMRRIEGDHRRALEDAALSQAAIGEAPVVLAIAAVESRTRGKYGRRASRYVRFEVGHAAQNVLLQAEALNLDAVVVGAFRDAAVDRVLRLSHGEVPLYLIAVGRPR